MNNKYTRILAIAVFIIIILLLTLGFFILPKYFTHESLNKYALMSPEQELLKLSETILADRAELEKYDVFKGSRGEKDAGPYLNKLVPLSDGPMGTLTIHPEILKQIETKNWETVKINFSVTPVDFSWMERLSEFDHWANDIGHPSIDLSQKPQLLLLPLPQYGLLLKWAKLRLLHGRASGTIAQALKDVRQLARLIFTNDNLVSVISAVAILRFETKFVSHHKIALDGWTVVSQETLNRAKRYFYATPTFVDPRLSDQTLSRFSATKVGECVMLNEGVNQNFLIRDSLRDFFPREIARFNDLIAKSFQTCRKGASQIAWQDSTWPGIAQVKESISSNQAIAWYFERNMALVGALTLEIGSANFLKQYQEKKD